MFGQGNKSCYISSLILRQYPLLRNINYNLCVIHNFFCATDKTSYMATKIENSIKKNINSKIPKVKLCSSRKHF